ncbi:MULTISPECIES: FCD domain-containing protein [unclassified Diaminobutyricimonas]|uniref:FadR/GntR family transcriptional regulator n=1 Tax=unclassified Diaminobutyricimonas TaxID=2643261 RepID=UPI0012F5167E|nr:MULTISPECIES: FCD domain-containing protein [unclassified Diaminobutyricimonas]
MATSLHSRVVDEIGRPIVDGDTPAGAIMLADTIEKRLLVSRSVVREAVRVLQSMGLVESIKHLGIRVLPQSRWNFYDPLLIRWRLDGTNRAAQIRSLTEVRCGAEPLAAEMAARYCPPAMANELCALAEKLREAAGEGDMDRFVELDLQFHSTLFRASGNELFSMLQKPVAEILERRVELGLIPENPLDESLQKHLAAATAIRDRDPERARAAMATVMQRAMDDLAPMWEQTPRVFTL